MPRPICTLPCNALGEIGGSGFIFVCASARDMMGAWGVKETGVPWKVTRCLVTEPGIGEEMS